MISPSERALLTELLRLAKEYEVASEVELANVDLTLDTADALVNAMPVLSRLLAQEGEEDKDWCQICYTRGGCQHRPPGEVVCITVTSGGGIQTGWKLVPIEPTEEMYRAADAKEWDGRTSVRQRGVYQAMIAAAPDAEERK